MTIDNDHTPNVGANKPSPGMFSFPRIFALAVCLLLVLIAAFFHFEGWWRTIELSDLTKPTVSRLTASTGDSPSGISIHITGKIDGEVEIWADNWERQRLSGTVNVQIYHDFFESQCDLHCEPRGVASGKLAVRYKFH